MLIDKRKAVVPELTDLSSFIHRLLAHFTLFATSSHPSCPPLVLIFAVHVFETSERGRTAHYKLTSTVMLYMVKGVPKGEKAVVEGEVALGGSMTRQVRLFSA